MTQFERTDFNPPRSSRGVRRWNTASNLMQAGSLLRLACFFANIRAGRTSLVSEHHTSGGVVARKMCPLNLTEENGLQMPPVCGPLLLGAA